MMLTTTLTIFKWAAIRITVHYGSKCPFKIKILSLSCNSDIIFMLATLPCDADKPCVRLSVLNQNQVTRFSPNQSCCDFSNKIIQAIE